MWASDRVVVVPVGCAVRSKPAVPPAAAETRQLFRKPPRTRKRTVGRERAHALGSVDSAVGSDIDRHGTAGHLQLVIDACSDVRATGQEEQNSELT